MTKLMKLCTVCGGLQANSPGHKSDWPAGPSRLHPPGPCSSPANKDNKSTLCHIQQHKQTTLPGLVISAVSGSSSCLQQSSHEPVCMESVDATTKPPTKPSHSFPMRTRRPHARGSEADAETTGLQIRSKIWTRPTILDPTEPTIECVAMASSKHWLKMTQYQYFHTLELPNTHIDGS